MRWKTGTRNGRKRCRWNERKRKRKKDRRQCGRNENGLVEKAGKMRWKKGRAIMWKGSKMEESKGFKRTG